MEFHDFSVHVKMLPPPKLKKNEMVAHIPLQYVTKLVAETEESSLQIIMKCVTIFSTSHDESSPTTEYASKP